MKQQSFCSTEKIGLRANFYLSLRVKAGTSEKVDNPLSTPFGL
jgi:hypothetical protein